MRQLTQLLSGFFLLLVFAASVTFSYYNSTEVVIGIGSWQLRPLPVSVWIIGAFVTGGFLGLLLGLGLFRNLRSRVEIRRLNKALREAEEEVSNLRSLSLRDIKKVVVMDSIAFYMLLLVAVTAGWLLGRFSAAKSSREKPPSLDLFQNYFVGLNYLLNDEPDEAIDTFIKALEINSETIETHLALGALLRRRGKVDKAINVHQALLARPNLEPNFTNLVRLQLALNYIAAGLLDRAERLLKEVLEDGGEAKWDALAQLITIYQTEKEWEKAIASSTELLKEAAL